MHSLILLVHFIILIEHTLLLSSRKVAVVIIASRQLSHRGEHINSRPTGRLIKSNTIGVLSHQESALCSVQFKICTFLWLLSTPNLVRRLC